MTPDNPLSPYERAAQTFGDIFEDYVSGYGRRPSGRATRPTDQARSGLGDTASVPDAERGK